MPAAALPALREELLLHDGPPAIDGSPTWSLQDPVRNRFFRIDWSTFLILLHWHLGRSEAICDAVQAEAPLELTPGDVDSVAKFLAQSELLQCPETEATRRLYSTARASRRSFWTGLLHHYLFFRVPLLRPDAWLTRLEPYVRIFYSRQFLYVTLTVLVFGLLATFRQWSHFSATFIETLSWRGLAAYAGVFIAIKCLHELGHAFTAKRFGCRVPAMGIAFLVLWPVAYTDVNETWKLAKRAQRLAVGAAGVLVELAVAAWATFAWAFLPDGTVRECLFLLAAVTWISTLVVNASPFMRFDGYFLLADALDIPNLHSRAFALARWHLREALFAPREAKPEHFAPARERFLVLFAWTTWLYRLVLFVGIAVLVYRYTFKALGIVLFVVELAWFVVVPVARELQEWRKRAAAIRVSPRARWTGALALLLVALFCLPLDSRVSTQAVLRPARSMEIYAPEASIVLAPMAVHGSAVSAGQPLIRLHSPELAHRMTLARLQRQRAGDRLKAAWVDGAQQADLPVLKEQVAALDARLADLEIEEARLTPLAAFAGTIVDPLPNLRAGDTVSRNERLATLIDRSHWQVRAYLEEKALERIEVGGAARFYPETPGSAPIDLKVASIDRDATRVLSEKLLGSLHGGALPVRLSNEALIPERALYGVTLVAENAQSLRTTQQLRGTVIVEAQPRAVLAGYFETAAAVLIRESGW